MKKEKVRKQGRRFRRVGDEIMGVSMLGRLLLMYRCQ